MLATRLFDELRDEHGLGERERLLLQVAGAPARRRHLRQPARAPQALAVPAVGRRRSSACPRRKPRSSSNIARYHRGGLPQESHLPYIALDRDERLIVNKLAAMLRLANALDAEHLQKVRDVRLVRGATATWMLELDGDGRPDDGAAGGDGARPTCSRDLRHGSSIDPACRSHRRDAHRTTARCSSTASCRGWRSTSACSRRRPTLDAAARAGQVRRDRRPRTSTSSSWCASPRSEARSIEENDARPTCPA